MELSILGLVLGLAYLILPIGLAWKVVAKDSFGGIFSQEFPLAVVTLPLSVLGEWVGIFRRHNYVRLGLYLVAALVNASLFYLLGIGIAAAIRFMSGP